MTVGLDVTAGLEPLKVVTPVFTSMASMRVMRVLKKTLP